ncbi:CRISPR-associated endonuclease Cas1 [Marinilongibacter aquaticus]|uniref:CRISPR-associated endonuclease Cas1 n=1 Tax=Marinilongibacter aquaticus TaxID=2975157 RepID=UPI0021BD5F68|nr:CRISPR-associated endonuclease Cas1 [Marinilongibacter aquaticus]UBM60791.1 CRISPR-associated endonuclease Cas1 [Marinilongibacter aquaticus]
MQLHINTYGTYVHVKDAMFEIRRKLDNGNLEKRHFAASKVRQIVMTTGMALSTDAVKLAMEHNVDLLFIEQHGKPIGRVWHSKLGSTTKIRKAQLQASLNERGLTWVKGWLIQKMENQRNFIQDLKKHRATMADYLDDKITKIENLTNSVQLQEGQSTAEVSDTLRGLEGTAGRLFFETLSQVLPKESQFKGRSNRPAKDPFNAFLNYAYGMLYGKIEKVLIVAGLDPFVGFMHRDDYNQLSMVYDFIEPYRICADEVVFRLFSGKKVNKSHTTEITGGSSLNTEGKALLVNAFNKFMDDNAVRYKGRNLVRSHIIQLDAHRFANSLIEKEQDANLDFI